MNDHLFAKSQWPACLQWHCEMRHRIRHCMRHCMRLHFPLNTNGQLLSNAGLLIDSDERLDDFRLQQAVVLAQQASTAIQIKSLTRLVRSSVVLSERKRMGDETHDSLAKGLMSIAMQSESINTADQRSCN